MTCLWTFCPLSIHMYCSWSWCHIPLPYTPPHKSNTHPIRTGLWTLCPLSIHVYCPWSWCHIPLPYTPPHKSNTHPIRTGLWTLCPLSIHVYCPWSWCHGLRCQPHHSCNKWRWNWLWDRTYTHTFGWSMKVFLSEIRHIIVARLLQNTSNYHQLSRDRKRNTFRFFSTNAAIIIFGNCKLYFYDPELSKSCHFLHLMTIRVLSILSFTSCLDEY